MQGGATSRLSLPLWRSASGRRKFRKRISADTFRSEEWRGWDLHADALRNRVATDLNPENVFVLEGSSGAVSQNLATLNQWSTYF